MAFARSMSLSESGKAFRRRHVLLQSNILSRAYRKKHRSYHAWPRYIKGQPMLLCGAARREVLCHVYILIV